MSMKNKIKLYLILTLLMSASAFAQTAPKVQLHLFPQVCRCQISNLNQ